MKKKETKKEGPPKKMFLDATDIHELLEIRDMGGLLHGMVYGGGAFEFTLAVPFVAFTLGKEIREKIDYLLDHCGEW